MKMQLVATRDIVNKTYGPPVTVIHVQQAVRDFLVEARRPEYNNRLWTNPADFELWHIAEYDDTDATIANSGPDYPRKLCNALDAQGFPPLNLPKA